MFVLVFGFVFLLHDNVLAYVDKQIYIVGEMTTDLIFTQDRQPG